MTVRTGAGMAFGRRVRPLAALLVAGGVLLAGCSGEGDETASSEDAGQQQDSESTAQDDEEVTVDPGPVAPPTEPAKITPKPGKRSVSGSTDITIEGDRAAFASPSGGIVCTVNEQTAACQVLDLQYTPQNSHIVDNLVGPCPADEADTVILYEGRGGWTCLDEKLTRAATTGQGGWWVNELDDGVTTKIGKSSVAVLPYGSSISVGPVSCSSAQDGVRCRSSDLGRSFFISRSAYLFG